MNSSSRSHKSSQPLARSAGTLVFALISLLSIWRAGSYGLANILSRHAIAANQISSVDLAAKLNGNDPEVRISRAALLEANGDLGAAVAEYEQAVVARPDDYVFWLALARAAEMNGDSARAIAAAREATKSAPYYAEPHWQLGNILVRAGQQEEGFRELSAAASSDPSLFPGVIDLAWQLLNADSREVERAINPRSSDSYRALAQYFRKKDQTAEAISMFKFAGPDAHDDIRAFIAELISKKKYAEAYELWALGHNLERDIVHDGGFEKQSDLKEPGFGWRIADPAPATCRFTLDGVNPKEGNSSLRLEFSGDSDPLMPIISQLILLQPLTHYELQFAARTEKLLSAGLPVIVVIDANDKTRIAKSEEFPRSGPDWREYAFDFTTGASTTAIQVDLQREGCAAPCPIFGRLWLDAFSLRKL